MCTYEAERETRRNEKEVEGVIDGLAARSTLTNAVAHQPGIKKLASCLRRRGRWRTNEIGASG
jgi:hypothetical protein